MTDRTNLIRLTEITDLGCSPDAPLRETLVRMNATTDLFQLVLDPEGKLLGTLTDGDIRRAFLAGAAIDDPTAKFMNSAPRSGPENDLTSAQRQLIAMSGHAKFLPLVDDCRRVVSVLVQRISKPITTTALIMAGGRGSRLGDATQQTPKPLLTINGIPMIEHVLRAIEAAGIRDVFVSAHYLAEQIEEFCVARNGDAQLTVLRETAPYGTAGALSQMPQELDGSVLLINGDVVSNVDLAAMHQLHVHHGWDATVAVARHELEIPYGVVRANEQALFLGIEEKPRIRNFVSAGIYLLDSHIRKLVPKARRIDMPELLEMGRDAGLQIGVFPIHENWRDVGRPADLEAVNSGDRIVP